MVKEGGRGREGKKGEKGRGVSHELLSTVNSKQFAIGVVIVYIATTTNSAFVSNPLVGTA